tara:strand:- start:105 stop:890 length:786 start_codon:yes stop_codon:yes gene_type:complete
MKNVVRLIISNKRIKNLDNNQLTLSDEESHYLNKVMRLKIGKEIQITNGEGYLWKGIKNKNNFIEIPNIKNPILIQDKKQLFLGIAVAIPKNGFDDILKMCTEIGIDFIQPLYSEHQIKRITNKASKMNRWNTIINEAVEQSEILWKPKILNILDICEWIISLKAKDIISISLTRDENCISLNEWLKMQKLPFQESTILWNVIGPEGGWSEKEICFFKENKIQFIKLSESILRTSTAAITASSVLSQWRSFDVESTNLILK